MTMKPLTESNHNTAHLKHNPLFEDLTYNEFALLSNNVKYLTHKKGDTINFMTGSVEYTYIVISGSVKSCEIDQEGTKLIKDVWRENDFFGGLLPGVSSFHFEYAEAISDRVLICRVPSAIIKDLIKYNPRFSLRVTCELWSRYKRIENRLRSVACLKDVKTRLINFFRDWALREGVRSGNSITLKNYLTHKDIACLICSTRVTVTNILNELRQAGDLNYSKGLIEIVDIDKFN